MAVRLPTSCSRIAMEDPRNNPLTLPTPSLACPSICPGDPMKKSPPVEVHIHAANPFLSPTESEITAIIHHLTQSSPSLQRRTIETYFTPSASFTHPFCRTGSFEGSRWLIWCIYRWYKILSPRIEISVDSIGMTSSLLLISKCETGN